jgi:hypothetical protein
MNCFIQYTLAFSLEVEVKKDVNLGLIYGFVHLSGF